MIRLDAHFLEALRLGTTEAQVGRPFPWSLFDRQGRLLVRRGAMLETSAQLVELSRQAAFRLGHEPGIADIKLDSPFFVIGEMMGRLNSLLGVLATGRAEALLPLKQLATAIQVLCAADARR